jgi:hypothetical protein
MILMSITDETVLAECNKKNVKKSCIIIKKN